MHDEGGGCARLRNGRVQLNAALCSHGVFCVTGRVSRLQFVALIPAVLAGQSALPTTGTELAAADRPTWAAALAAACDGMPIDSTWRGYRLPRSELAVQLPHTLVKRGELLRELWFDVLPAVPTRNYGVQQLDPVTTDLFLAHAASIFKCESLDHPGTASAPGIRVVGFDLPGRDAPSKGVWNVIATWPNHQGSLLAMSTTLWGARAFVTGMRLAEFPGVQQTPP